VLDIVVILLEKQALSATNPEAFPALPFLPEFRQNPKLKIHLLF